MKLLMVGGLAVLMVPGAFAQVRGGHSGAVVNGFGTNSGWGSVVFPAGRPTTGTPFTLTNPGFGHALGNVVAGRPAFTRGGSFVGHQSGAVFVPFAYPVYGGGYYGNGYYGNGYGDPAAPQQPGVTVIYPPQQTPVIINQVAPPPVQGQINEYGPGGQPYGPRYPQPGAEAAQGTDAPYYLLAFKDHSIYSAVGYWVDGDTLHYLTTGNVHNQASVSLLDRDLTEQLNKGRGLDVKLPAPSK
jgi:hypothetical protein